MGATDDSPLALVPPVPEEETALEARPELEKRGGVVEALPSTRTNTSLMNLSSPRSMSQITAKRVVSEMSGDCTFPFAPRAITRESASTTAQDCAPTLDHESCVVLPEAISIGFAVIVATGVVRGSTFAGDGFAEFAPGGVKNEARAFISVPIICIPPCINPEFDCCALARGSGGVSDAGGVSLCAGGFGGEFAFASSVSGAEGSES